jgi:hypothetical protein
MSDVHSVVLLVRSLVGIAGMIAALFLQRIPVGTEDHHMLLVP